MCPLSWLWSLFMLNSSSFTMSIYVLVSEGTLYILGLSVCWLSCLFGIIGTVSKSYSDIYRLYEFSMSEPMLDYSIFLTTIIWCGSPSHGMLLFSACFISVFLFGLSFMLLQLELFWIYAELNRSLWLHVFIWLFKCTDKSWFTVVSCYVCLFSRVNIVLWLTTSLSVSLLCSDIFRPDLLWYSMDGGVDPLG